MPFTHRKPFTTKRTKSGGAGSSSSVSNELNRLYVERLLRQIDGAGVGTLTKDERAFMERMAKLDAPARPGVRPPPDPWPSPA